MLFFGKVSEDFEKIIRTLARMAAASDVSLTISPLVNTDRKGGAFPIMLQPFWLAIGVAIVCALQNENVSTLEL